MSFFEIAVIILYLVAIGWLGWMGYSKTKTSTDYLLAGRDTHPFVMALSYGATFISTAAIVGFGGVAAWLGNSLLWLTFLNIFVGVFIAFVFIGNPTRKMGLRLDAHTFPEFLGKRYDSKFIQVFAALIILAFMPLYATAVLIGGVQFLSVYFGVDYHIALLIFSLIITAYVLAGGLKGVMYTDALQGAIMFFAMVFLIFMVINSLGGIDAAFAKLDKVWQITVVDRLSGVSLKDLVPGSGDFMMKLSQIWGFEGWNKMPVFMSPGWLFVITTITLGVGIGVLAQPQLIVRFMTVKSKKELNRAVLVGGIFILAMTGVIFIVGSLTNAWYFENMGGKNALEAAGAIGKVIPHFINIAMPHWFSFIFLFALISAAMSTLSSQFHTMGTAVGRDILETFGANKEKTTLWTKIGIVAVILFSVFLAYKFQKAPAIIARSTAIFFALCASIFLPAFIFGLFSKRITKPAAIASMIVGFLVSSFWLLFCHFKEAKALGVAKALFGVNSLLGHSKWAFVDALVIALPLSTLTLLIITALTKPDEKIIKRAFGRD
ncbi:sodium:solute symporter family protein [Caminibacter pacificus]|uniref:SSS family solute:Na+ symporter n=1 Tax=Caminibacter pacificus TaxID=1424653 RepID=A0AAJ4RE84_9BACT|nr:sodium:solute symporter family protein [Caminibacter pacificus]QCI28320.1 sodium:solute symporter family protein [Caminibacter pacificus]ROR40964.1 SSS family solute:Na+ symporter [Caminibacter pacificus]